jgi:hypothetical protein
MVSPDKKDRQLAVCVGGVLNGNLKFQVAR